VGKFYEQQAILPVASRESKHTQIQAERNNFHKAEQQDSESVRQYFAKLQKLAEFLSWGSHSWSVCLWFASKVNSTQVTAEVVLPLPTAVEKACAAELRVKEASWFHGDPHGINKVVRTFPECFRNGKQIILRKIIFIGKLNVTDGRSLLTSLWSAQRSVLSGNQKAKEQIIRKRRRARWNP